MRRTALQPALGFIAGVLIGLSIITPVFGATSPGFERWNGVFAALAIALLVSGFTVYGMRAGRKRGLARVERDDIEQRR